MRRNASLVFRLPEAIPVEGMGIDTLSATYLGRPARERLLEAARDAGLSPGDDGAAVITLTPGSVATAGALRRFAQVVRGRSTDAVGQLAEPMGRFSDMPALGEPARLLYLAGGGAADPARVERAERIVIEAPHRPWTLPVDDPDTHAPAVVPMSDAVLTNMGHWAGVLWSNLLGLAPGLWGMLLGKGPVTSAVSVVRSLVKARSVHPDVLAGAASYIHRRARVHPTAVVEASYIGPGAEVGPGAIVRQSIVGEGAVIEPQGMVVATVMGPRARLRRHGWLKYGVMMEDSVHGGVAQLAVLGPRAVVKGMSALMDQKLGGPVHVKRASGLHPVPLGFLGVGVGARTVVGSGVWVAAGRTLPPDKWVVRAADAVLARPDGQTSAVEVLDAPPNGGGAADAL